jgi:predicted small lipoprotein YifL
MKRVLGFLALVLFTLSIAACGNEPPKMSNSQGGQPVEKDAPIGGGK